MKLNMVLILLLGGMILGACNLPISGNPVQPVISPSALIPGTSQTTSQATTSTPLSILTKPANASLILNDNTNCRAGPGTDYEKLTVVPEGASVAVLARSTEGTHFLVDPPDNITSCWVLAELGTFSGEIATVPQATSSAGENAGAPARPSSLFYNYQCSFGAPQDVTTTLSWGDTANNENGYRVYRYGVLIIELPANSTAYTDETSLDVGDSLTYSVEAFNDAGSSAQRIISFSCSD
jgi:hypothetical protein